MSSDHHHLTPRQYALLRHVASGGSDGADTNAHPPVTVRCCDRLGFTSVGDLSPAGSRRFITTIGIEALAWHDAIGTRPRGFAAMSQQKVQEIARKGGIIAHAKGRAWEFSVGDPRAIAAGRKGAAARVARAAGRPAAD